MDEDLDLSKNVEIQKALKDFEVKSETDAERRANQDLEPQKASSMADLVIKHSRGNIKDLRHAEYVLLGFIVVAIGISLYLFFGKGSSQPVGFPSGYDPKGGTYLPISNDN